MMATSQRLLLLTRHPHLYQSDEIRPMESIEGRERLSFIEFRVGESEVSADIEVKTSLVGQIEFFKHPWFFSESSSRRLEKVLIEIH